MKKQEKKNQDRRIKRMKKKTLPSKLFLILKEFRRKLEELTVNITSRLVLKFLTQ